MSRISLRAIIALMICAIAWFGSTGAVRAQDKNLDELKARLDKLEKQNEELRKQLTEKPAAKPSEKDKAGASKPDKKEIEKAVDDVLKEKEKKKKEEDAKKAAEKEAEFIEVGKLLDFKAKWINNNLWFETDDKSFRMHVKGRGQIDAIQVHAPQAMMVPLKEQGIGEYDNAINFRRARIGVEGTFWEVFDYDMEFDFLNSIRIAPAGGKLTSDGGAIANTAGTSADRFATIDVPVPTDLWIQWKNIPILGNVRIGNQKEWISMEHLTSSRYLDFLERSWAFDAFVENGNNGFVPGISVFRTFLDESLFVGAGYYMPNFRDPFGWNVGDGEGLVTARIAGTPYYEENGRYMLHLGLGYMHSTADDGVMRFRGRPMVRNGPAVLHNIAAQIQGNFENYNLFVPEFMVNYGPWTFEAEYYAAFVEQRPWNNFMNVGLQSSSKDIPSGGRGWMNYGGGYVEVAYFLTGESRGYDRKYHVPTRQPCYENAFCVDGEEGVHVGWGAWQILARYEYLNLNSQGVNGGIINGGTWGVNWYLNPNSKIQVNYTLAHRDATEYKDGEVAPNGNSIRNGYLQGLGARFAFDF